MEALKDIDPKFLAFLDPTIRYNKQMGPEKVPNWQTARRLGANCVAFVHLMHLDLTGQRLPSNLGAVEMWEPNPYLFPVEYHKVKVGDFAFFGRAHANPKPIPESILHDPKKVAEFIKQFPAHHIAMVAGKSLDNNELVLLHNSFATQGPYVWMESRFSSYRSTRGVALYEKLHGVRRAII